MTTRRDFLSTSLSAGALAALGRFPRPFAAAPMRILVLGGTGFIGPHLVRHAVARGHQVTIFTRGRRDAEIPSNVERLVGERPTQLDALKGRTWDAVIDENANDTAWVRASVDLLKGSVGRYLFTSSTGVYYPYLRKGLDESTTPSTEQQNPNDASEKFGVTKAQCERVVLDAFGDRGTVIRPGYIVGPGDTSDRFPYWPVRLAAGGEVLAPGHADDPVQFIDVRDVAELTIRLIEDGRSGPYNAVGPKTPMTMPQFLDAARDATGAKVTFVRVDDYEFLKQQRITALIPWILPEGSELGSLSISNARAVSAGLTLRPVAATARDTLAWWPSVPQARRDAPRFGLTMEREARAIAAWKARKG